jgi:enamine deaminase RidA (YjgF/YER057c/UK114 family)
MPTISTKSTKDIATGQIMSDHVEYINPPALPPAIGYSQVIKVAGGTFIFVSGQVPVNRQGQLVGEGDLRRQSEQVFENVQSALSAAGARMNQIIKLSYYVVNLRSSDALMLRELRQRYLDQTHPPASTMVGVVSLFDPKWLIEIEAVALVP